MSVIRSLASLKSSWSERLNYQFKTRGVQFLCTLVLTICKDSTVSVRGVRAKAHIAGNRESWEGFSYVPHLSTISIEMGLIPYTPLSSLLSLSLSVPIQQPFCSTSYCQFIFLFHLCLCFLRNFSRYMHSTLVPLSLSLLKFTDSF